MDKTNDFIVVCCYNRIEHWENRDNAIQFYRDACMHSEGAERERYVNIYFDLTSGKDVCTDGVTDYLTARLNKNYSVFDNPNNTRDYEDKIYYPKN